MIILSYYQQDKQHLHSPAWLSLCSNFLMCLLLTEAWKSSAARSPGHLGILPTLGSVCPSHGFSAFGGSQLTCSGTLSDTVNLCGFWKRRLVFSLKVLKSQEHPTFSDQRQHWAEGWSRLSFFNERRQMFMVPLLCILVLSPDGW